jgi:hypothetical protein
MKYIFIFLLNGILYFINQIHGTGLVAFVSSTIAQICLLFNQQEINQWQDILENSIKNKEEK